MTRVAEFVRVRPAAGRDHGMADADRLADADLEGAAVHLRTRSLELLLRPPVRQLPAPAGEAWVVVRLWPLELALGFRCTQQAPCSWRHDLLHGPFTTFVHEAEVRPQASVVEVHERVVLALPRHYGGMSAARWLGRRLLDGFEVVLP
jgi:hypothetical protein